jgi:hypothetical protein
MDEFEKFEKLKILKKAIDKAEAIMLGGKNHYEQLTLGTKKGIVILDRNEHILEFMEILNEEDYKTIANLILNSWEKRLEKLTTEFKELLNRKVE